MFPMSREPSVTLGELLSVLERRAAESERMQAHAPVAAVLHSVLEELRGVDGSPTTPTVASAPIPDRLLTIPDAAARLGVTSRWLYRRADTLPFMRRLSRRALRVSQAGLERWMERRR